MRAATRLACLICLSLLSLPALAAQPSLTDATTPAGTWRQVDDDTGKVTSIIRIDINDGKLTGTVVDVRNMSPETIARDGNPPVCTQCEGKRHNQPIEGMVIMWGLTKDGDEWNGGHVLDPKKGKIYKVKLNLIDHGQKLKVRGYMGISLFGRTQVWQRVK
ncbi:MAG TPA: DUF2147 domain-containing protein [Oleiagrimonas sp.]|nr:DUF2147 domain-containing protein [Oleiagrimonas sp.]